MLKLLSKLISFKTVYGNYQAFEECTEFIKQYFKNTNLFISEFEFNQDKSIVISNSDSRELDIIFCGHLDVVPADDDLFNIKQNNGVLLGRGVADMKGQVAVMMQIFLSLETNKKVALFLTCDEERGGFNGVKKLLNDEGYSCKVAIVPDGGFDFKLVTEEKGVLQLKISTNGVGCHSSQLWEGDNAISKLFEFFKKITAIYPIPVGEDDWRTSFNLAKFNGGDAINKVPSFSNMHIDIRHILADTKEDILNNIRAIDENIDIEVLAEGETFYVDEKNYYVKKYLEVCEKIINKKVETVKFPCSSDGRFFSSKQIPCIVMNPIGGNIHCVNEWVSIDSLQKLFDIYKQFINVI